MYTKYATTLETSGYFAGMESKLQLAKQSAQFFEDMTMIHEVLRSSSAMVCNEEALSPFRDFVVKVGDGVADLDKDRKTKLLDYDAHKRRHKALEDKKHSNSNLSASEENDLNKFAQKLQDDDEGIKMVTAAEDDTIRRSKLEHDALMDDYIVTLAVCQARLFTAAGERLNALVATLPPEKVAKLQAQIDANIEKGGAMITDQKSAARVALDAVAGKTTVAEAAAVFVGGAKPPPLPSQQENTTKGSLNLPSSNSPLLNFSSMGKSFFGKSSDDMKEPEMEKSSDIPDIDKIEKLDLSAAQAPLARPPVPMFTPESFQQQQAVHSRVPDPTFTPAYFPKDANEDKGEKAPPMDPEAISNSGDFSGYTKDTDLFQDDNDNKKGSNPFGSADEDFEGKAENANPSGEDDASSKPSGFVPEPPPAAPLNPPVPIKDDIADVNSHLQEYIDPITSSDISRLTSKGTYAKVIALYDSTPEEVDELEFYKGDIIEVIEGDNEGWSKGFLRGIQGMFPSNYVEPYVEPSGE